MYVNELVFLKEPHLRLRGVMISTHFSRKTSRHGKQTVFCSKHHLVGRMFILPVNIAVTRVSFTS